VVAANGTPYQEMGRLQVNCYERGHSDMRGFRRSREATEDFRRYEAALAERIGRERAESVLADNRHNALVYPSLSVHPAFQQLRVIVPLAVDRTLIEIWCLKMPGAPQSLNRRTIAFANAVHSPASIVKVDDLEAYERVQTGLGADSWVSLHRGAGRNAPPTALDEGFIRNQYRAWLGYMGAA
jgi:hypothetical protein